MSADATLSRFKRPIEEFRIGWNFINDLEASDTISVLAITAATTTGVDATATFLQSPSFSTDPLVTVQIQGGTDGLDYEVTFKVTTAQGDVFSRVVLVKVKA